MWPGTTAASTPPAFELLQQVRQAYAALPGYRDHGVAEVTRRAGAVESRRRLDFETTASATGDLVLVLHGDVPAERHVLWRRDGEVFHYDGRRAQWKPAPSFAGELAAVLGDGGPQALVVPIWLAEGSTAVAEPEAASVEGEEPCGTARCWVLLLGWQGASVQAQIWVDRQSLLVRRTEVRVMRAAEVIDQAVAAVGLTPAPPRAGAPGALVVRATHEVDALVSAPPDRLAFTPPPGASRVDEWTGPAQPEAAFGEEITVALSSVVVRAVDGRGRPILGLRSEDFRVVAKGKEIPVLAADWHGAVQPPPQGRLPERRLEPYAETAAQEAGKLVVFFVQADLHPSRIRGQLRLRPYSRELLDTLAPEDRVAVVSFDSHLHLWLDLTRDREAVHRAIDRAMLLNGGRGGIVRRSRDPSRLAAHFDFDAARDTASPERALQVTAEALRPLPGEKALIYLGWGLGRYGSGGVRMTPDYEPAVRALLAARATVFVLDVTDADYHSLEVGLESVAEATGGTYAKTHLFPSQATGHLAGTISGYYVLALDTSALPAGAKQVRVTLRDRPGEVFAQPASLPATGGRGGRG